MSGLPLDLHVAYYNSLLFLNEHILWEKYMAVCLRSTAQNNSHINKRELYFSLKEKKKIEINFCFVLLLVFGISLLYATGPNAKGMHGFLTVILDHEK